MEKQTLTYYKWTDVRQLLCKELNVTEEEFDTVDKGNYEGSTYESIFNSIFIDEGECYLGTMALVLLTLAFDTVEEYIEEIEPEENVKFLLEVSLKLIKEHNIEYIMF